MATPAIKYTPLYPQYLFHNSYARQRFYGGSAGGGKSKALRIEAVKFARAAKKLKVLFLRRTFPELEQSIINPMLEELPKGSNVYHSGKHRMKFANESIIQFGHAQNESDIRRYQGSEWDMILIDELTTFTEFQYKYLLSRLRTTKGQVLPCFAASGNPGGVGHVWVKRLWIDRDYSEFENPNDFEFIRSSVYDNPYLMKENPEYVSFLKSLPVEERRALLDGDWDVFAGQFFQEFRRDVHTIAPMYPKENVVKRIVSLDYGFAAPACVLWSAIMEDGRIITYRELYVTDHTYARLAIKIRAMTKRGEQIDGYFCDPSIVNKRNDVTGTTGSMEFAKHGIALQMADNDRADGWATMRQALLIHDTPNGKESKWVITTNCQNLIRTLPQMQYDKIKTEDLDTSAEDHACFIGVTKIRTSKGLRRIDEIKTGDLVLTRSGFQKVKEAGKTGTREVYTYHFSNGTELTCTPDHPVFVKGKGFSPIDTICYNDRVLCAPSLFHRLFRSSKDGVTTSADFISSAEVSDYIVRFGKSILEKLKMVTTFTIKTRTGAITRLRIWKKLNKKHTSLATCHLNVGRRRPKELLRQPYQLPGRGINLMMAERGTQITVNDSGRRRTASHLWKKFVRAVEKNTRRTTKGYRNSVVTIVRREHYGIEDVYNLTVENKHEYFANDILVHNCDAARYGLKAIFSTPKPLKTLSELNSSLRNLGMVKLQRDY